MRTDLNVGTWASIADDCPMEFKLNGDHGIELLMGSYQDSFEMIFSVTALERFLGLAHDALAEAKNEPSAS